MGVCKMTCKDWDCGWCYRVDSKYISGCVGEDQCDYKKKPSRIDVISQNGPTGEHYSYPVRDTVEEAVEDMILHGVGVHYKDTDEFFTKSYMEQKRQMMEETRTKQDIAAEAYQILGSLAYDTGVFENENVIRALDYFWGIANDKGVDVNILPWELSLPENEQHDLES